MKIVIDIPESIYETIEDDQFITRFQLAVLQSNIRKGVPLPKGHGRLIDADAFIAKMEDASKRQEYKKLLIDDCLTVDDVFKAIIESLQNKGLANGDAPTIIEADTAESEDKHTEERTETHACDCNTRRRTHACDCISREAALDCLVWRWPEKTPATKIMELPSVETEKCGDCISRAELKQKFQWLAKATKYGNEDAEQQNFSYSTMMMYEIADMIEDAIDSCSSVEPERKTGKWEYVVSTADVYGKWVCSECNKLIIGSSTQKPQHNYCPDCGADMREVDNGRTD